MKEIKTNKNNKNKNNQAGQVGQDQLYDLLVSRELSWQAIIYDLIKTEQLDPWNIDLVLLVRKYIEKIRELEELEEGSFFISSKVLLAAALLLRIKSNILHNNILSIDEILFEKKGKKTDEAVGASQMVDFIPDDMPEILPRTPIPRGRKVTLQELMKALDKAINTEHRRIKKELSFRRAKYDISIVMPKKTINIKEKIKDLYKKIRGFFVKEKKQKLTYTTLVGKERNERIACFLPILYLDNQEKITLEQEKPFEEISIWLGKEIEKEENENNR